MTALACASPVGPSYADHFFAGQTAVWVVRSAADIAPEIWDSALSDHCRDARFYEVLERTVPGQFDYRYFVFQNQAGDAWSVQPFFFIDQDATAGLPAAARPFIAALRKIFPRFLILRMLMVGCSAGEGNLDQSEPWVVEALREALEIYSRISKTSLVLLKDFPASYRALLAPLTQKGFCRVPSMPAAKLDLHFASFEDYLQTKLSKVYRKNLRRKFRKLADFPEVSMEVMADATPHVAEIFALYRQTFSRSEFRFEELTEEYFSEVGRCMPDKTRFFLWRQNGRIVAFNLCQVHDGVLYDLDIGLDYSVALDLHLYFVTLRDTLGWAIANGLKQYHTGPLNYDPKLHLKLDLAPHDLYARHTSRVINPFFKIAIKYLQPVRHDPILSQFHNAQEMIGDEGEQ